MTRRPVSVPWLVGLLLVTACATAGPSVSPAGGPERPPGPRKSITIGVTGDAQVMGALGSTTTSGGWHSARGVHSNGLVTTDYHSRAVVGRLAEKVPTIEDQTMLVLPDGTMHVTYRLRRNVTWQDGVPFTAHDLVFTHRLYSDPAIPVTDETAGRMSSVEAPDDYTAVFLFKEPYYEASALGLRDFWPAPRHLLIDAYERYLATGHAEEVLRLPYWTTQYVHLGPFRLTFFETGQGASFEAYDGYFLGRPKIHAIHVRTFSDANTLFANALAGAVDVVADGAVPTELGIQLKQQWEGRGEGTVTGRAGVPRFLVPQYRPLFQKEPANLDVRVRAALYHAIDREAVASKGGELASWSALPPGHELYEATRDGFRPYQYDPDRARALLRDAGWIPGPDAILRHASDGRRFQNAIWGTAGARTWEIPVYADYWQRIGLEVDEHVIPASLVRNLEARATYPSWEVSGTGYGDNIISRLGETPPASAETRWVGSREGYVDPLGQQLVNRYRTRLSVPDRFDAMKAISDYMARELPILVTYFTTDYIGVRKGVQALDDLGGAGAQGNLGAVTRNSYLWDVP
jgi:peptide/nickel transport system substrate-binding protein